MADAASVQPLAYVCPVCKQGSAVPFRCGGPHPRPKRKRLYYDFVDAVPVAEVVSRDAAQAQEL